MPYKDIEDKIKWKQNNKDKEKEYRDRHKAKTAADREAKNEAKREKKRIDKLKKKEAKQEEANHIKELKLIESMKRKTERINLKTKICSVCKQETDKTDSGKDLSKYDGYYTICKECKCNKIKEYNKTNCDAKRKANKKYKTKLLSNDKFKNIHEKRRCVSFSIGLDAKDRDRYKCVLCNATKHLKVHHIIPVSINPDGVADINNMITLCEACHLKAHDNDWRKVDKVLMVLFQKYINEVKQR